MLFIATTLSACSSTEFPTGTFTHQIMILEFGDDKSFTLIIDDEIVSVGTYSIEGDEIKVNDSFCKYEENAGSATYKWLYEDGALSFELIGEDLCDFRHDTFDVYWFGPE